MDLSLSFSVNVLRNIVLLAGDLLGGVTLAVERAHFWTLM